MPAPQDVGRRIPCTVDGDLGFALAGAAPPLPADLNERVDGDVDAAERAVGGGYGAPRGCRTAHVEGGEGEVTPLGPIIVVPADGEGVRITGGRQATDIQTERDRLAFLIVGV